MFAVFRLFVSDYFVLAIDVCYGLFAIRKPPAAEAKTVAGGFVIGFFTAKYGGLYGNGIKSLTNFAQMLRNY